MSAAGSSRATRQVCPKCGRAARTRAPRPARAAVWCSPAGRRDQAAAGRCPWTTRARGCGPSCATAGTTRRLHDAFVKHCSAAGRLPAAGRMYRACLDRDPSDAIAAQDAGAHRRHGDRAARARPSRPGRPSAGAAGSGGCSPSAALAGVLASLLFRAWRPMKIPAFELPAEEIRASLEPLRRPLSIAVLRSHNPFNVGAIIRTAHSFLVRDIVLVGERALLRAGGDGHAALREHRATCRRRGRAGALGPRARPAPGGVRARARPGRPVAGQAARRSA